MESFRSFFEAYGWGLLALIGSGLIIALLIEIIIKNPVKWLEEKWKNHERLIAILQGAKMVVTQVVAWVLCIWFSQLVCKVLPLPGAETLLPIWVSLAYVAQFIFSCFGIKGILALIKKHEEKKNEPKEEKHEEPKEVLTKTSVKGVYRNSAGILVDKNNNPIEF